MFEHPQRYRSQAILFVDQLALLGDAQPPATRTVGPASHQHFGAAAAAIDAVRLTVKKCQVDARRIGRRKQRFLRLAQQPPRANDAALLVTGRVTNHHVLVIGAAQQVTLVSRFFEQLLHHFAAPLQRLGRFEQRRDVGRHVAGTAIGGVGPAGDQQHRQHVVDALRRELTTYGPIASGP